jgi:hypothetical protein
MWSSGISYETAAEIVTALPAHVRPGLIAPEWKSLKFREILEQVLYKAYRFSRLTFPGFPIRLTRAEAL